jgi:hypothetical protein
MEEWDKNPWKQTEVLTAEQSTEADLNNENAN